MIGVVAPNILAEVRLGPQHRPTGFTRHYYGYADGHRVEVPHPVILRIAQYDGDEPRAYLFYCDDSGEEMTDTLHDSVAEAMEQATAEFGVQRYDWDLGQ
ncbi:hypothetical protein AB0B86_11040 [Micromonospora sp. NPDC049047]|uniref:hypothetical protein n=1 Tax=Micromonospora sp. NPDC049047 TaxID=3155645 RepID=UPI0033D2B93A